MGYDNNFRHRSTCAAIVSPARRETPRGLAAPPRDCELVVRRWRLRDNEGES